MKVNKGQFIKEGIPWNKGVPFLKLKGIPRTQEVKDKISKANKGKKSWIKGKTFEEVHGVEKAKLLKNQISKRYKEKKYWKLIPKEHYEKMSKMRKGMKFSEETKRNMSLARIGKKMSEFTKNKLRKSSSFYIDGRTPLRKLIFSCQEAINWRNSVYIRDNYICQECFCKKKNNKRQVIHAHHKIFFNVLLNNFLKEYNQFSPIEDKDVLLRISQNYKPFWDINNGITLCKPCHLELHKGDLDGETSKLVPRS